jgi:signal peptidase II
MLKVINYSHLFHTVLFIILAIVLDQCAKIFISKIMLENSFTTISVFSFLELVFVRNTGISFGLFSEGGILGRYFFSAFSITVGLFIAVLAFLAEKKIVFFALCLISAGAIANAIDRVYFGGVIDFIDFFVYNFHWPAFNFADIFITVGVFILLYENFYSNYAK